jgi:hypothetical protein
MVLVALTSLYTLFFYFLVHSLANGPEVNLPAKSLYLLFHCHYQEHLVDLFFYHHKGNKATAGDIKERIPCCNLSI